MYYLPKQDLIQGATQGCTYLTLEEDFFCKLCVNEML